MNVVSYQAAKFLAKYGYPESTLYRYSQDTGQLSFWFEKDTSFYPAPTYEEAVEFLWINRIAQIYLIPIGFYCKGVIYMHNQNKIYTTKRQFKSPQDAYEACLKILVSL